MCFQWLKKLYRWLRGRCARRGYSSEISVHHRGLCSGSGAFSGRRGHGDLFYDGENSITYSRRPSGLQPTPASPSRGLPGGYPCGSDGSVVIAAGGDAGGTSGWDITVGTVPVYGSGCGSGDSGTNIVGSSGGAAGSSCYGGSSAAGGGYSYSYGYGYEESPRVSTTGGGSGGLGYYGGGSGYGLGAGSGAEFSPAGAGSCQAMQQKCPVVVPSIKSQQTKQSSQWPPSQKK